MQSTKNVKHGLKKLGAWGPAILHARAKASAAMHGQTMEQWLLEAAQEKLAREEKRRSA